MILWALQSQVSTAARYLTWTQLELLCRTSENSDLTPQLDLLLDLCSFSQAPAF